MKKKKKKKGNVNIITHNEISHNPLQWYNALLSRMWFCPSRIILLLNHKLLQYYLSPIQNQNKLTSIITYSFSELNVLG